MQNVVLDTNALLMPFEFRINLTLSSSASWAAARSTYWLRHRELNGRGTSTRRSP